VSVSNRRAVTGLMTAGLILLQAAWILVMPPFGAVDEFDHAYRASAAAHGEIFTALGRPEDGRGLLVTVNDGIAAAARAQCEVLEYPGKDNCNPVEERGGGMVTIASAAAIYQPTYYLAVGWGTFISDGYSALYLMRVISAALCAALFALAVWMTTGWSRSPWPLISLAAIMTPTTLYSVSILAPNGVEMMLGLALWAALIGAARTADPEKTHRYLVVATPLACLFAWVRPFSPVWLFFLLLAWLLLLGRARILTVLRLHRRVVLLATSLIALSAASSTYWVLSHSSNEPPGVYKINGTRWGETLEEVPLWFLQVISGVPFRNTPAPFDVYMAGLVLFAFILLPMTVARTPRIRLSAALILISSLGVAIWYTYSRLPTSGTLWQGRYAWCLALGVVLLAGVALEDRRLQVTKTLGLIFGVPALFLMQLRTLDFVLRIERRESPLVGGAWSDPSLAVVIVLAALGLGTWTLAIQKASLTHRDSPAPRYDTAGIGHS
jgi:hypothetical protein